MKTAAFLLFATVLTAQTPADKAKEQAEYVRSHYTKFEFRIPMRDGVKLFTSVYVPKDTAQPYPIIMGMALMAKRRSPIRQMATRISQQRNKGATCHGIG